MCYEYSIKLCNFTKSCGVSSSGLDCINKQCLCKKNCFRIKKNGNFQKSKSLYSGFINDKVVILTEKDKIDPRIYGLL